MHDAWFGGMVDVCRVLMWQSVEYSLRLPVKRYCEEIGKKIPFKLGMNGLHSGVSWEGYRCAHRRDE
jgi:hypothetical protein